MEKNVGNVDKIIRVIIAIVFAYLGYQYSYWLWIVTVLLLFTVVTGSCLPYKWLGISTAKKK